MRAKQSWGKATLVLLSGARHSFSFGAQSFVAHGRFTRVPHCTLLRPRPARHGCYRVEKWPTLAATMKVRQKLAGQRQAERFPQMACRILQQRQESQKVKGKSHSEDHGMVLRCPVSLRNNKIFQRPSLTFV